MIVKGYKIEPDANLRGANLSWADLSRANLSGANLSWANLRGANLYAANLSGANLSDANLKDANIVGANFSGTTGILSAAEWLAEHLDFNDEGYIVYKAIGGTAYDIPEHWQIAPGAYLEEVVNSSRTTECACGVNVGTYQWVKDNFGETTDGIWECLLAWRDLADVCVPYNTDGKFRAAVVRLIEKIE